MSKYAAVNVKFNADISGFSKAIQNASRQMQKAGDQLTAVGKSMTMNLTAPIVALGAASLYTFGQIDSLKRGLITFAGSAAAAEKEFEKLREVAKLPGIGLEEATRGSINLQAIGMSADDARTAMMAFGNAIATVGGGKENFDLAIRGFGQLTNASKPLQQDLYQIANQLPQVNKLMIEAFGTNRAEDLANMGMSGKDLANFLVKELGKLPPVAGGIKNSFENMSDSLSLSLAKFGESIEKNFDISGKLNAFSNWIGGLASGFEELNPVVQKFILVIASIVAGIGPLLLLIGALVATFPTIIAGLAAIKAALITQGWGAVIVAIGTIIYLLSKLNFTNAVKGMEAVNGAQDKTIKLVEKEKRALSDLISIASNKNISDAKRLEAIKAINEKSPEYLGNITKESILTQNAQVAIDNYLKSFEKKIRANAVEAEYQKLVTKEIEQQLELDNKINERAKKGSKGSVYGLISDFMLGENPAKLKENLEETRKQIENLKKFANKNDIVMGGVIIPPPSPPPPPTGGGIPDSDELTKAIGKARAEAMAKAYKEFESIEIANAIRQADAIKNETKFNSDLQKIYDGRANITGNGFKGLIITTQSGWSGINKAQEEGSIRWMQKWSKLSADMRQSLEKLNAELKQILIGGFINTLQETFNNIGENITMKEDPFKNVGKHLLDSLGKLMATMGAAMLAWGINETLFDASVMTLNGPGAIAAGIGMMAAGAAISSIAKKGLQGAMNSNGNGGSGGYGGSSSAGQASDLVLVSKLDGRDLVLSSDRTTYLRRR